MLAVADSPKTEVPAKARRRKFGAEYKLRILREAELCTKPGELGALLRGRHGDRHYTWQKSDELAERLVRHSTAAGALVVDPFAGSGTFLLAAARLGRRAIGCDQSEEALRIVMERGCRREE